jgi:iron complex outermembrane receptor protein
LIDKLLQLTTAAFQITKNHVAITDPNNPNFSLDGGEMRSQGFESDLIGQITPELQIIANYTYTDTKVIESSSQGVGDPFNVSPNSGSLWLAYTFQDGRFRGLGAGAGIFASSSKPGGGNFAHPTYSDTFRLPGYAEMDTGAWYTYVLPQGRLLKFQVNVFNVFDRTYYESSANTGRVEPGAPLSAVAKVSFVF